MENEISHTEVGFDEINFKQKFSFLHDEEDIEKMELFWDDLTIKSIKKKRGVILEETTIINSIKGVLSPSTFTAILGPSGSGKTTLLNFLSGRISERNLEIKGTLQLNKVDIPNIDDYSNKIAYVQQNDILLAIFTPFEALNFSASIRLNIDKRQREEKANFSNNTNCLFGSKIFISYYFIQILYKNDSLLLFYYYYYYFLLLFCFFYLIIFYHK